MSLRLRLILLLLLVNAGLLGIAQVTSYELQQRWLEENAGLFQRRVWNEVLQEAYRDYSATDPELAAVTVQRLLVPAVRDKLRAYFRDTWISSTGQPSAAVDVNPMGAHRRDPALFPYEEIRAGIREAMAQRTLTRASSGFCLPIIVGDAVVGGAWFEPILPPPPQVPFIVFAGPVLGGTLVFGLLASLVIGGSVVRPLRRIGVAARRFGAGRYDTRMPRVEVPELAVFVDAFNAMAARIEGQHAELEREVERATEEAKRKERALLNSARLASMGTLAAGIAHEINNPIGGMRNALRRIEVNPALTERERVYVDLIRDGLDRVGGIARRVLDFSPRTIEARPFLVADAVEGARALVEHRFTRQAVDLRTDLEPGLGLVGDRHEFQQVILNLLINSLDVLEDQPGPRWIAIRGRVGGDGEVCILVEDNGPGMPNEDLDRVMDPFFSGKGRPDASGLGMFISYSIVRNHGGSLSVDSAPGAGFRVTIVLPGPAAAE
jgi:signal transduction histidine kinase